MIYKIVEEKVFTNNGKVISEKVEQVKVALKTDLLGRQFVFMQEGNCEDLIIYGEGGEKKKAAQQYDEVLTRLKEEWKFKEEKAE